MKGTVDIFTGMIVGEDIVASIKDNKSMTYRELLTDRLGVKYLPDELFSKFLECLALPEARDGEVQKEYVKGINDIIKEDGYELYVDLLVSGTPQYIIGKRIYANLELKNLIFAPIGVKPDIVIENSISNELKLVGDTDSCLLYNFDNNADGLTWTTLINWWKNSSKEENIDAEMGLYNRLKSSLDSDIEKIFFRVYYNYCRHPSKEIFQR